MRISHIFASSVAVVLLASPVVAFNQKDATDCAQASDPGQKIDACTRLLKDGTLSNQNRSIFLVSRGFAWITKRDPDVAIADFNEAIHLDPKNANLYRFRGFAWSNKQEFDRAIADFSEAIRLDPKSAFAYSNRGVTWKQKGEFDRAIADLNEAIRLNPKSDQTYLNRGGVWFSKGEFDRAIADFTEAIRLNPKLLMAYNDRGHSWMDKGDYERAIADFNEAIRIDPTFVVAYANRGEVWRLKGDLDRALVDQDEAIKIDPKAYVGYARRADTLRYKGEFERALADYDAALRILPDDAVAHTGRGLTYERMNDLARARADFEKALASPTKVSGLSHRALITARDHLAAFDSGAALPTIPAAPSKVTSATSIPTPKLDVQTAAPIAPAQGHRVALVIGNSAYKSVAALPNPQHDAEDLAAALRAVGFETVTLVEDATREKLIEAVLAFAAEAEKADWAVIYYGGHGIEANGLNYLVPIDAKLATDRDIQKEAVPLDQIMTAVEGAKKLRLVLLDACRNNPFAPLMQRTGTSDVVTSRSSTAGAAIATRSIGRGLGEVKVSGATLVVYAAKHGQVALDGEGANSPFAIAVVQRLATPGVDITKIFRLVRDDVMEATAGRQEPFTYGSLPGREDFYFVAK